MKGIKVISKEGITWYPSKVEAMKALGITKEKMRYAMTANGGRITGTTTFVEEYELTKDDIICLKNE